MDLAHQRVVVFLVLFHGLDILLLSLLNETVQPALLVLGGGRCVNNQCRSVHFRMLTRHQQVLELLNRVLIDHGHDWVRYPMLVFVIERTEPFLNIIEGHDWVAEVRPIAIDYTALQLLLVPIKSHPVVLKCHFFVRLSGRFSFPAEVEIEVESLNGFLIRFIDTVKVFIEFTDLAMSEDCFDILGACRAYRNRKMINQFLSTIG